MRGIRGKLLVLMATGVALVIVSSPVFAHHGTAAFETGMMVTVTGNITELDFTNPHVKVFFETKTDKGEKQQWQGELTAPNKLSRAGWTKNTLKPGDAVTISGFQAKSGAKTMWIRKLVGPTGESLPLFED